MPKLDLFSWFRRRPPSVIFLGIDVACLEKGDVIVVTLPAGSRLLAKQVAQALGEFAQERGAQVVVIGEGVGVEIRRTAGGMQ